MAKEKGPVADFVQTRKRINDYFGCEGDFFIHPLLDFEWAVREDEDFTFLCYWTTEGKKIDAVVVKKKRYTYDLQNEGLHHGSRHRLREDRLYLPQRKKSDTAVKTGCGFFGRSERLSIRIN